MMYFGEIRVEHKKQRRRVTERYTKAKKEIDK
jgi:hypothetical protein